jgi:hypothetical protein
VCPARRPDGTSVFARIFKEQQAFPPTKLHHDLVQMSVQVQQLRCRQIPAMDAQADVGVRNSRAGSFGAKPCDELCRAVAAHAVVT